MRNNICHLFILFLTLALLAFTFDCYALEINGQFSISGILAGAYQYQDVDGDDDLGRGAVPLQLALTYAPGENDVFSAKFGFAAGNGLIDRTGFALSPWTADLEDDTRDINGRNRDYLLTAWYMHRFEFGAESGISVTGGIIDATDYLDENTYSNDEYTQFMNEALVNGPNAFLPSYDIGASLQFTHKDLALSGVLMHIGENDTGNSYNFYGLQLGYTIETFLGPGNYRMLVGATSNDFLDPSGLAQENRKCLLFSFDQQFGSNYGTWLRMGTQDDAAAISYKNIYSGGIYISGQLWGRQNDNGGIGYAHLNGGNTGLDTSRVLEAYIRFGLNDYLAFTMDIQYMNDDYEIAEKIKGFIYGLRMAAEF